ncbi:MAG: 5-formyltetrahydrofolate cyclo-ligase [Bacteroidales bacterium]|nr:5-formyltetrahydrofolate cyclo-ligase [Bacteroidales bacterium]
MDTLEAKKSLRKEIKSLKARLTESQKQEAEEIVLGGLLRDKRFMSCQNIIAYSSLPDELPTSKIISELMRYGHNIYLPVIIGENIEFHLYEGVENMKEEVQFGIKEPLQSCRVLPENEAVSIIVPGIAFTTTGKRLGRGGGYYDRYLTKQKNSYKVGVAFKCQCVTDIPTDEFDISMDKVLFG